MKKHCAFSARALIGSEVFVFMKKGGSVGVRKPHEKNIQCPT